VDDRRPNFPHHKPGEPIGSGAATVAETVQLESSPVVYCGTDRQVSDGFRIALQIMGLDQSFPVGIALAAGVSTMEDN
jgi:hypothetical protein